MNKKSIIFSMLLFFAGSLCAQTIWNTTHLEAVKKNISLQAYAAAYQQLLGDARKELTKEPLSVMMKEKTPASGNKHDYMSQARYYWADPAKPDGLPYISRDGESNPELEKLDRVRLGNMANGVINLSLAWYFSGDEKYARKATELIRVWFLNKDTRMNPNLNYAQMIPGHNEGRGRSYGVIDTYSFIEMLDAVQLLEKSKAFTAKDSKQLKEWFGKLVNWVLTSDLGQEEGRANNNHSVAHDAQLIAFAIYAGNKPVAERVLNEFPAKRIFMQIEPDGSQPQELRRTLAFGYSEYNIQHMIDIFQMGQKIGIPIDNATSTDGRNFYKAVDFLIPYFGKEKADWPYQQISDWDYKQLEFSKDLYRAYLLNPSRTDYLQVYRNNRKVDCKDRFNLLFLQADITDHALAFASGQLEYAMECVDEAEKKEPNKRLVSPRTVEKDGSLRLVAPRDWCSGFFPGSLWHVFTFNRTDFWRQQAISYYHVVDYNPETGAVRAKHTHQGIHHESVWSRGQAWGLYGFTMCFRYTKNPDYLKKAEDITGYFFSLPNMPDDLVPYWDMKDPAIPQAPRDASAAAIIASALYELATYTTHEKSIKYRQIADTITNNLYAIYQAEPKTNKGFLLLHSTGNYPKNDEIDAPISYADYYYLEALLRRAGITTYQKPL